MDVQQFDIASVERETGIGKDALRAWERRYGFPQPLRDDRGERLYPAEQVERLRLVKRLLNAGHRPAKVVALSVAELTALLGTGADRRADASALSPHLKLIAAHDATGLRLALTRNLMQQGLMDFLIHTISPLNVAVGEAWLRGEMRIFEEHLYSHQLSTLLREVISSLRNPNATPRVLLTTLPGEEHQLGLLMAEAVLALHGAACINLGTQTPVQEILAGQQAHRSDIVLLSCSSAMPLQQIKNGLQLTRDALPSTVSLWAGGAGVALLRSVPEGVQRMDPLTDLVAALDAWRGDHE